MFVFGLVFFGREGVGVSLEIRSKTKIQHQRGVWIYYGCMGLESKDHIKTLLTDTHWIAYEVDKVLFSYCSGDSRAYNAIFLPFNALAFKQVKGTAQAE